MSIPNVIVDGTQSVLMTFMSAVNVGTADRDINIQFVRDSTALPPSLTVYSSLGAADVVPAGFMNFDRKPAAGTYDYALQWNVSGGATAVMGDRVMSVIVFPDL